MTGSSNMKTAATRPATAKMRLRPISLARGLYRVTSRRWVYIEHEIDLARGSCTCEGYSYRRTCAHLELAKAVHPYYAAMMAATKRAA